MVQIVPIYFFISLCIGFLIVYSMSPKPRVIIKNPTPDNAGKILYRDDNNVCYKYHKVEVPCINNRFEGEPFKNESKEPIKNDDKESFVNSIKK